MQIIFNRFSNSFAEISLLDFIAAIHEMSAMISIDQMLEQAFELLGGTEFAGLTVR